MAIRWAIGRHTANWSAASAIVNGRSAHPPVPWASVPASPATGGSHPAVRTLDALCVHKNRDGSVETEPVSDLLPEDDQAVGLVAHDS